MHTIQPQRFQFLCDFSFKWRLAMWRIGNGNTNQTAEGGFTLSEVIVAILLVTTFVAVALQGMVVAMLLKSRSLQLAEANRWIQADLEQMRSQITLSVLPIAPHQSRCHPTTADAGFADLVRDNLAGSNITGTADYQLPPLVAISQTGKTFQIDRTLRIPSSPENIKAKLLGIQYKVTPTSGVSLERTILHFYTEVIPDAAFQCQ
jgi:type II secretory pathway pseudopilin PulG